MAENTWTKGHFRETILDKVLSDQYLTAMCIEDYISSMSDAGLKKWVKTFIEKEA